MTPSDVRAVVDERFRWWSDRQAEHLAVRGQDYAVAIMRDFWAWHESENSRAPREPAGEARGIWDTLTPEQQRKALAYDGPQDFGLKEPVRDVADVPSLHGIVRDHFAGEPAPAPAPPAPPAGGEIEEAIHRIDSIAFEASYRRDWETVTAALAAERAEVGRLKTVWAMEGLMRRLLALALNDWEQEHGVRSGYEKDGADHWSAQARTVFASDPTDAIGTKILTERDEARAESARLRAVGFREGAAAVAAEARRYAAMYTQGSDGRNTFIMLAEWAEQRATPAPASDGMRKGGEDARAQGGDPTKQNRAYLNAVYQNLLKWLAKRYVGDEYALISKLCDEHLDRSGALLGYVRDAAAAITAAEQRGDATPPSADGKGE